MSFYTKTVLFARRLSIFYLFVGIFSVFFGVFYYRYIPANQAELNSRGFRILNQLASNMAVKNDNLKDAFDNVKFGDSTVLPQINDHVHFATIDSQTTDDRLDSLDNLGWCLYYRYTQLGPKHDSLRKAAVVRIGDFVEPVFATRDDLFDNYVLVMKDTAMERWRVLHQRVPDSITRMLVLYQQKYISSSPVLSMDSVLSLQKNTDLAVLSTVTIAGRPYTIFFQPFEFAGLRVVLCGLVDKNKYERQVKTLPTYFVAAMILVILLGLMALPFVKVFFISPREPVQRGDVLRIVLALYLGAAVLVLAGAYFLAYYSAQGVVEKRLEIISGELGRDIDKDLRAAGRQLEDYVSIYDSLGDKAAWVYRKDTIRGHKDVVDAIFTPREYPLVSRLTWFDKDGNTILKWNPFTFYSSYVQETAYPFFAALKRKDSNDYRMVLDAGQSNVTGEFQMLLARRLDQPIDIPGVGGMGAKKSFGIVLSFYLHSGLHSVLPRGYGFCLVNNQTMQVMMHSDSRRNLAENLYQETDGNDRLKYCIDQRLKTSVLGVDYYGSSHSMFVRPVAGQDVSLVVFYDDDTHSVNILRMMHFGAEALMYISLLFFACLFLSTTKPNRPSKLSFSIDLIEWVRPVQRNWRSYHFTWRYFGWMIVGSLAFFIIIRIAHLDIRSAFYLSALLPFYALWGFVASRKKVDPRFPPDRALYHALQCYGVEQVEQKRKDLSLWTDLFRSSGLIVIVILLLNVSIIWLINLRSMDYGAQVGWIVFCYQALLLAGMILCYYQTFQPSEEVKNRLKYMGRMGHYVRAYICSLYYSVLVMSLIPAMGLLWYGWAVEKIQFIRSDELQIAVQNVEHMKYVARQILPETTPAVLSRLEGKDSGYSMGLLYRAGHYLPTEKIRYYPLPARRWLDSVPGITHDPDQPYINFLDELFLLTSGEYNSYSVAAKAADSSWIFNSFLPDSIRLFKAARYDSVMGVGGSGDPLVQDFTVNNPLEESLFTWWGGGFMHCLMLLLITVVFLWALPRLLALSANRLFLLQFIWRSIPTGSDVIGNHFHGGWTIDDFIERDGSRVPLPEQEEYILETMLDHKSRFQQIWDELPREERYFIYDFADDGYTNYKDSELLFTLLRKGLLRHDRQKDQWSIFAISFREFILRKKGSTEISRLKEKYSVPGLWATIRIPALIIIVACAVLLILTQESVSHQITVAITSLGAIVPIILEVTKKITTKGAG